MIKRHGYLAPRKVAKWVIIARLAVMALLTLPVAGFNGQ